MPAAGVDVALLRIEYGRSSAAPAARRPLVHSVASTTQDGPFVVVSLFWASSESVR